MKKLVCKVFLAWLEPDKPLSNGSFSGQFTYVERLLTKQEVAEATDTANPNHSADTDEAWTWPHASTAFNQEHWRLLEEHLEDVDLYKDVAVVATLGSPTHYKLIDLKWEEPHEWGWREIDGDTYTGYDTYDEALEAAIEKLEKDGWADPDARIDGPFPMWEGEAEEEEL